jgi:hypothetical protein
MKSILTLFLSVTVALAWFSPNVRIDRGYAGDYGAIIVGPSSGQTQPIYVALTSNADVVLQKSTDAGRTWLAQCQVVCSGSYPDVAIDAVGNVYVACIHSRHYYCTRSTDGGVTWSEPARIDDADTTSWRGWPHVAADTTGNLFCAWTDVRSVCRQLWSSVSTDQGTTWSTNVRVDQDTTADCYASDVYVQPGTNAYLVAAVTSGPGTCLYRSTDMGQTFLPGAKLDTGEGSTWGPYVVADRNHIICDYTRSGNPQDITYARTLNTPPDTWGDPRLVTNLGSRYTSYCNGGELALSADGRVHAALMVRDFVAGGAYLLYYTYSSDHGISWADRELINDDTMADKWNPNIAVDASGQVYVVWQDWRNGGSQIWFSTSNPIGIAEQPPQPHGRKPLPSVVRRLPSGSAAFDAMGRRVLHAKAGIYFVRTTASAPPRKVLLVE